MLSFGKELYLVSKVRRLAETIVLLDKYGLSAKGLTMIYPKLSKGVDTFIVKAVKGAKSGLTVKTLIEMHENGEPTDEFKELYK